MNNQRFDNYRIELHQYVSKCEFNDLHDFLIKDILIVGLKNLHLTDCLLWEPDIILRKAIQVNQATKEIKRQAWELTTSKTPEMDGSFIKCWHKNRPGTH